MTYKFAALALVLSILVGCSTIPEKPILNTSPINVADEMEQYWISKHDVQKSRHTRKQVKLMRKRVINVVATYLVDSNGNVYNVKIVESNGEGLFEELVKKSLQRRNFSPAKGNLKKQPVYARSKLTFELNK